MWSSTSFSTSFLHIGCACWAGRKICGEGGFLKERRKDLFFSFTKTTSPHIFRPGQHAQPMWGNDVENDVELHISAPHRPCVWAHEIVPFFKVGIHQASQTELWPRERCPSRPSVGKRPPSKKPGIFREKSCQKGGLFSETFRQKKLKNFRKFSKFFLKFFWTFFSKTFIIH